jgi:hypothetical protein
VWLAVACELEVRDRNGSEFLVRFTLAGQGCVSELAYVPLASAIRSAVCGRRRLVCVLAARGFLAGDPVTTLPLAHQKILENQIPFAAGEWSTATAAFYFLINRVGSGFDFDHAIERVAVQAMER